jgi:hypothetical protein
MTSNWLTKYTRNADKVDSLKRSWANEGFAMGVNISRIAKLLNLSHADVTAIYYADGHWRDE